MGQALQNYEQSHDLHALQVATGSCQVRLEQQDGEDYAGAEPPVPLAAPSQMGGRRNIGCGWWPIRYEGNKIVWSIILCQSNVKFVVLKG